MWTACAWTRWLPCCTWITAESPASGFRTSIGGNKNLEAIEFFKHLNSVLLGRNPGAVTIAEESTAWPMVTGSPEEDGLGFSFKWNMGWMNDFLEYMKLDPYFRKGAHNLMTFAMTYAYSENYILVLSHDEVVHLKCSMINKMPGEYEEKFANLKAAYAFMLGHPGKKLLFMGQEFAQLQEWSEARELDWYLLEQDQHRELQAFVKALLHLYQKIPGALPAGYPSRWLPVDQRQRRIPQHLFLYALRQSPEEEPALRLQLHAGGAPRLPCGRAEEEAVQAGTGQRCGGVWRKRRREADRLQGRGRRVRRSAVLDRLSAFGIWSGCV